MYRQILSIAALVGGAMSVSLSNRTSSNVTAPCGLITVEALDYFSNSSNKSQSFGLAYEFTLLTYRRHRPLLFQHRTRQRMSGIVSYRQWACCQLHPGNQEIRAIPINTILSQR